MKPRLTIAFACYLVLIPGLLGSGLMYLLRPEFMPYHAAAVGISWAQLSPEFQALFLALMRVCGGGWLAGAASLSVLVLIPFRRNEPWSRWAIPLVGLCSAVPTLYATLMLKARTGAATPWFAPAIAILLLVAGFSLAFPAKKAAPGEPAPKLRSSLSGRRVK